MLYLPDTNILIYSLSGIEPYSSWFVKQMENKNILFSAIVVSEFLSKIEGNEEAIFNRVLEKTEVIPVDKLVAKTAAIYRRKYLKKTKKVWLFDCIIAASCKVYGACLVTENKKDFPMKDIEIVTNLQP